MKLTSEGECLPLLEKENCVSKKAHRSCLWIIFTFILGAIILASCGNATLAESLVTSATAVPVPSPIPIPGLENIIPRPVSDVPTGGTFILSADTRIVAAASLDEVRAIGQYLADRLNPATGFALKVLSANEPLSKGSITLSLDGAAPNLGEEGYELTITPERISLLANQPAGLFHGVQTIRQLLPAAIDSLAPQPGPWPIDTGKITDTPRFAWRGAMLDVARHFFTVRDVTRYIDLLAYYKINRLHLHLSDDQGWRIQINSWPNLAIHGGSLEVGGTPGGYYSQADYAYIVAYAQSRYITIIPEIDMPGHITAALSSYPELLCAGVAPELFTEPEGARGSLCVHKEITYTFLENVIGELAALTPGPFIHIGGDEAYATEKADYIEFINRVQPIVAATGKQLIGWEEIAQTRLLPNSIVQHWNPPLNADSSVEQQVVQQDVLRAVQQGSKVIMSPAEKAYLDMKYNPSTPLGQDWAALISLETGYSWDPATLVAGITGKDILGVEAPLWSETLVTMADVEYMAFPRLPGYAEIGWTPQAGRDWKTYKLRLAAQGARLKALGVNFYPSPEIIWP
jgi:hexosaminidase